MPPGGREVGGTGNSRQTKSRAEDSDKIDVKQVLLTITLPYDIHMEKSVSNYGFIRMH